MRCVFYITGAFLGRVEKETRCAVWFDDPADHAFDPARLVSIDLTRTPNAAAAGEIGWDEVQIDDAFSGPNGTLGGTTLGARWPELALSGVVVLEEKFRASLEPALRPPCPPHGGEGHPYEFMSVLYAPHHPDARAGRRYAGHHARIVEEQGRLALVEIHPPGASARANSIVPAMWIDLSSPEQCDAGPESLTTIGVGEGAKFGALFLICGQLTT